MILHGSKNYRIGQIHILRRNLPQQRRRIFHQIYNLIQKRFILHQITAALAHQAFRLQKDQFLAFLFIQHDKIVQQLIFKTLNRLHFNPVGTQDTMAAGKPPNRNLLQIKRQHIVIKQGNKPADRAGKAEIASAPLHRLRKTQMSENLGNTVTQQLLDILAFFRFLSKHIALAVYIARENPVFLHLLAAHKPCQCLGRPALFIIGNPYSGAAHLGCFSFGPIMQTVNAHHQTARRRRRLQGMKIHPIVLQKLRESFLQLELGRFYIRGGKLLHPDFKQILTHALPPGPKGESPTLLFCSHSRWLLCAPDS